MSDWKPGNVLVDKRGVILFCIEVSENTRTAWKSGACLVDAWGNGVRAEYLQNLRPLVVIDPEEAEQVARFREIASRWADDVPYDEGPGDLNYTTAMQAALREFANPTPPKPDEPTGLGAVVEDAEGGRWIRAGRIKHGWHLPMGRWAAWDGIDAVRVLSEGVPS